MRRVVKFVISSFLVGALSVGLAWAGATLVPVDLSDDSGAPGASPQDARTEEQAAEEAVSTTQAVTLQPGEVLAGAAKVSMFPRPEDYRDLYPNADWVRDQNECEIDRDPQSNLTHVADFRVRWPEDPNCLYMGGFSIGPVNSIVSWDNEFGLWVSAVAISNGQDTVVITLIDGAYYFGEYKNMCGKKYAEEGCGFFDLQKSLGEELRIPSENFFFASSHAHTSPDFIAGWGGVPSWYMDQTIDSIKVAVREAVGSMRPATLEIGEEVVRERNGERRDFYRSAEEQNLAWFRAIASAGSTDASPSPSPSPSETHPGCNPNNIGVNPNCPSPEPSPTPEEPASSEAIFTVASYAAHPTNVKPGPGVGDADFPAVFAARVEEQWGGVGMILQTGLGNMSSRGNKLEMGKGLAAAIPDIGAGRVVQNPDVSARQEFWDQPVTNSGLAALGLPGFFDRPFNETPGAISAGKGPENTKCTSASPVTVTTAVSVAKIGSLWITGAPGEIFANYSNTLKERNPNGVTLPLALTNDGLGYIMQSFETDHRGRQALGFVGDVEAGPAKIGIAEYEDAYSIDACFGDMALETTINLLGEI